MILHDAWISIEPNEPVDVEVEENCVTLCLGAMRVALTERQALDLRARLIAELGNDNE